jgi:hypothetical protein
MKMIATENTARQAATKKNGLALKLQITKYKLQKKRNQVAVSGMLFKKGFPGCEQKILAQKTRN